MSTTKALAPLAALAIILSLTQAATAADLVVTTNQTLAPGTYAFGLLHVKAGATLTLQGNGSTGAGVVLNLETLLVDAGGTISANNQGFAEGAGPGPGAAGASDRGGGGGGHGGYGLAGSGTAGSSTGGTAYDALTEPTVGGCRGGSNSGVAGGAGGGAISLLVAGAATVNGTITANGSAGGTYSSYVAAGGGAGGSIRLEAATIAGSGTLQANGGAGGSVSTAKGGGGAGGRVAVRGDLQGALTLRARGGGATGYAGGAGTVALVSGNGAIVSVYLDNGGAVGAATPLGGWSLASIDVIGQADLRVISALQSDLVVVSAAAATIDAILGVGDMVVLTGSTLRHTKGGTGFFLDVSRDLLLASGATVNLDGLGSNAGAGTGAGAAGASDKGAGGGGHGGAGGAGGGTAGTTAGGSHHGSIHAPANLGSGGGSSSGCTGGSGGGRARFAVGGTFTLAGLITANGTSGSTASSYIACGGGAGGGVRVTAGAIVGGGTVRANGGAGGSVASAQGGGGGGGRISLLSGGGLEVTAQATGGSSASQHGGAGTVIRGSHGANPGSLEVVGAGTAGALTPLPGSPSAFAGVRVAAGGTLHLPSTGSATASGPIRVESGGIARLDGPLSGASLQVDAGGTLTHGANQPGFSLTVSGEALIAHGALVTADSLGSPAGSGAAPGAAGASDSGGGGGGHGGAGGTSGGSAGSKAGGAANGSITAPVARGSGGGSGPSAPGGAGGGVLRIEAGGVLTVDGTVSANGGQGSTASSYLAGGGGAGGTVVLRGSEVRGIGLVRANGAAGGSVASAQGGGGGGGRVVVEGDPVAGPSFQSRGGGTGARAGGAGTVLVRTSESGGELRVDNGGVAGPTTAIVGGPYDLTALTVTGSGHVVTPSAHALDLTGAVTVTGGTLQIDGAMDGGSLHVGSGGVVTHGAGSSGFLLTLTGGATVASGGSIDVSGQGSSGGSGVGTAGDSDRGGGGGGYGGLGGTGTGSAGTSTGGAAWGSALTPSGLGSAGGAGPSAPGGRGGGWVRLVAGGSVTVNGTIAADGGAGSSASSYLAGGGGSGGTIDIVAASVGGTGLITATGAAGGNVSSAKGGSGGGGRIRIAAPVSGPTLRARTGSGAGGHGAAGTILAGSPPVLTVDNDGIAGGTTALPADTYQLGGIVVRESAVASFATGSIIAASGLVEARDSGYLLVPGELSASNALIRSGGRIGPTSGSNSFHLKLTGDLVVESGASIDGLGRGLGAGSGTGAGAAGGSDRGGGGGGYGCAGGAGGGSAGTSPGGVAYGSSTAPADRGSGGGSGPSAAGGAGGGRVRLTVGGTARIDGTVQANGAGGATASSYLAGGGGSGGTVVLQAARLEGAGAIRAHGGAGGSVSSAKGGGGGGGRILLRRGVDAFTGTVTATGGTGNVAGCAGSVVKVLTVPAITDLGAATGSGDGEVDLSFTEPAGLDALFDAFQVVVHTAPITDANWWDATPITPEPPSPAGSSGVRSFTATGLVPGATYHFAARVVDALGASSVLSNGASAQAGGDALAPAAITDLLASPGGAGEAVLTWTAPADEGLGLSHYEVRMGAPAWEDATPVFDSAPSPGPAGAAQVLTVTALPTAEVPLLVRAVDLGGNGTVSNLAIADLAPPTVALLEPADGATVEGSITVRADAADGVGVDRVRFLVDGDVVGEDTTDQAGVDPQNPSPGWAWELDLSPLEPGEHTIGAAALDAWGNQASATVAVTVQEAPPAAPRIASPGEGELVTVATVPVVGTADAGDTVTVTVGSASVPVTALAYRTTDREAEDPTNTVQGCAPMSGGLTLADPADASNVALGRPAVASSVHSTPYAATEAVDGVADTGLPTGFWLAKDGVAGATLTVDLGGPWELTELRLLNARGTSSNRGTKDYRLAVSEDGANFDQVADGALPANTSTWAAHPLSPRFARYVRLTADTYHGVGAALAEIQAFGRSPALLCRVETAPIPVSAIWIGVVEAIGSPQDGAIAMDVAAEVPLLYDPFTGTVVDADTWAVSVGTTQEGTLSLTGTGAWGTRWASTLRAFDALTTSAVELRVVPSTGKAMVGLRRPGGNTSYTAMAHAVYLDAGTLRIYEDGTLRGAVGTYPTNKHYVVRFRPTGLGTLTIEGRPQGTEAWTHLYDSTAWGGDAWQVAMVVHTGTVALDEARVDGVEWSPASALARLDPSIPVRLRATLTRPAETDAPLLDALRLGWSDGTTAAGPGLFRAVVTPGQGEHTASVVAADGSGASAPGVSVGFAVDAVPPGAVTDLAVSPGPAEGQVTLSWTDTGDDGATGTAASLEVRHSTTPFSGSTLAKAPILGSPPIPQAAGTARTLVIPGIPAGAEVTAALRARDDAGHWSALSNVATSHALDSTPPVAAITSPAEGAHRRGVATVVATATDNVGVTLVRLLVGGQPHATKATQPWSLPWDTTAFDDGAHELTVEAEDADGNVGTATRTLVADNTPPALLIDPVESPTQADVTLVWGADDNLTAAGSLAVTDQLGAGPPFTRTVEGLHEITLTAADLAGNTAQASTAFVIDRTGPAPIGDVVVTVTAPGAATVGWTAPADALSVVSSYEVRFLPGPPAGFSWDAASPVGTPPAPGAPGSLQTMGATGLPASGTFCVAVRSTDAAGNLSPLSNLVVVDAVPPTVTILDPTDGQTLTRPVLIRVAAQDDVGIARVELSAGGALIATLTAPPWEHPWDIRALTPGPRTLEAAAFDGAGGSALDAVEVVVAPEAPGAPILLAPEDDSVHGTGHLAAAGLADGWSTVDVLVNGVVAGSVTAHRASEVAVAAGELTPRELDVIGESLALAPPGGAATNLALASAGGVAWGGTNPTHANDGIVNTSNYWSVGAAQSEALTLLGTLTLGSTAIVDHIRMLLYNGDSRSYYNYRLDVSDDGVSWSTWVDRTGSGEDYKGWQELTGPPTIVRHVRVWISGNTVNGSGHVMELQVLRATGGLLGFATSPVLGGSAALAARLEADATPGAGVVTLSFEATRDVLDERFDATGLLPGAWAAAGATLGGGAASVAGAGSWGARHLISTQPVPRGQGSAAWGRLRPVAGSLSMWGLKDLSPTTSHTAFPHAIYFNNGTLQIYEGGTNRGTAGSYTAGQWIEARVLLGPAQGATYQVRPAGAGDWTTLYTSTWSTDRELRWGLTVHTGSVEVDRAIARARAWSPAASLTDPDVDATSLVLRAVLARPGAGSAAPTLAALRVLLDGGAPGPGLGLFRLDDLDLPEGTHTVAAVARDAVGASPSSAIVTVHVDSGPPEAITDLAVESQPGGVALLSWTAPPNEPVASYAVYRSTAPITDTLSLSPVATVSAPGLVDPVGTSGLRYWAVVSFDSLGNASPLSNVVSATLDATAPTATASVTPAPPLGVGTATVTFTLSEPVASGAAFTWKPPAGTTTALTATQAPGNPLVFTAPLVITAQTASGTGTLGWSGADLVGNSGSALAGGSVAIDTTAPTATVVTAPQSPVGPGTVAITLTASEPLPVAPSLWLTPSGGEAALIPLAGGPTVWTGTLEVDGSVGDSVATFSWEGVDAAGNVGAVLTGASLVIDTTPPSAPTNLSATQKPGGAYALTWSGPGDAVTWRVYRALAGTPGSPTLVATVTTTTATVLPPDVGQWTYAVSAMDAAGNEGPTSLPVVVDGSPPPPEDPATVTVTTWTTTSLAVEWAPSANTAGQLAGYRLYRDGAMVGSFGPTTHAHTFGALSAGKAYTLRVAAFDTVGKEGLGTQVVGVTLVPNPTGVSAVGHDRRVTLTWVKAVPETQLAHYAIFVSTAPITTLDGLTPVKTAPPGSTSTSVTNLTNDVPLWLAVVSVNAQGKMPPVVSPVGATPHDDEAPAKPGALVVTSSKADAIDLMWGPTPDPGDLAGYELLKNGVVAATVGAGTTITTLGGLSPATSYALGVRSFDDAGNRSAASTTTGVTLVPNPTLVVLSPHHKSIAVTWTPTAPASLMQGWAIYAQPAPFVTVLGLQPKLVAGPSATQATVTGLTNGQLWYVAVTARNLSGGEPSAVSPLSATPFDDQAPPPPTGLKVVAVGSTSLGLSFTPSTNPDGDVTGGHVLVNGQVVSTLGASATTASVTGLSPANAYTLGVTAFDGLGHESAPVTTVGYTLVPNPSDLVVTGAGHERLTVAFTPPGGALVDHLRVYAAGAPFTSVAGLKHKATLASTTGTATVTGLPNGVPAWVAITTVNKSGGESLDVASVSGTPVPDQVGPEITDLRWAGTALGPPLTAPGTFSATVVDPAGIAFVRFRVDGAVVGFDSSSSGGWTAAFSPATVTDGAHTLTVEAEDTLGNASSIEAPFTVQLPPPPAPTLTAPADGSMTSTTTVLLSGQAQPGSTVTALVDGVEQPQTAKADGAGAFGLVLSLEAGQRALSARAASSAGSGPTSAPVSILVDPSTPAAPGALTATAKAGGAVALKWMVAGQPPPSGLKGFRVYRAAGSFDSPAQATLLSGATPQAAPTLTDSPGEGSWTYRASAVSGAGVESPLSAPATATADSTLPTALSITWTPGGPHAGDRVGPGPVAVTVAVSEPLVTPPFLAVTPEAGLASPVVLVKTGALTFGGTFTITPTTPSGTAQATISMRDLAGNQGTAIASGATLLIDTEAPSASFAVDPAAPIPNPEGAPSVVSVTLTTSEPLDDPPLVTWRTTASQPQPTALPFAQVGLLTWVGGVLLPLEAGATPEALSLTYEATDDLGNTSTKVVGPASFAIYQGELPPLDPPSGLSAEALPGGEVALTWDPVTGASGYEVRRQGPNEGAPAPIATVGGAGLLDAPGTDGEHLYEVATVRTHGGDQSLSAPVGVLVTADATPPGVPTGLGLSVGSKGVTASWDAPGTGEALTWALYRAPTPIFSVGSLSPIADALTTTTALDPAPSPSVLHYAVVARDPAGNVSQPATAVLDAQVLPIGPLSVVQTDAAAPVISWSHPSADLLGFHVTVDGTPVSAPGTLVEATAYVDADWSGGARTYEVTPVATGGAEGPARTLALPALDLALADGATLPTGGFAGWSVQLTGQPLSGIQVEAKAGSSTFKAGPVTLGAAPAAVPLAVTAPAGATGAVTLSATVTPAPGEEARVVRTVEVPVVAVAYPLDVLNTPLMAGATGTVRLSLSNPTGALVELVTARDQGAGASDQVRFRLEDLDGNALATVPLKQVTGDSLITLSGGTTVVRVQPGATWLSAAIPLGVPAGAPSKVRLRALVDVLHHGFGEVGALSVPGTSAARVVSLDPPPHDPVLTSASPAVSDGNVPILLAGTSTTPSGGPAAKVPVLVTVAVDGFERTYTVLTDEAGAFTATFEPLPGEAGVYTAWSNAVGVTDKAPEVTFTIKRVTVSPKVVQVTSPINYTTQVPIQVTTSAGNPLTGLKIAPGPLPTGVSLTAPPPKPLTSGSTTISLSLVGDSTAPASSTLTAKVLSDAGEHATVTITLSVLPALPALAAKPPYVETGVARGASVGETVTVTNTGLAPYGALTATLRAQDGSPAPAWAFLATPALIGKLDPGKSSAIQLYVSPPESVAPTVTPIPLVIELRDGAKAVLSVPVWVTVDDSGLGSALVKVVDIYTGTMGPDGQIIQGLSGAKVELTRVLGTPVKLTKSTDAAGEAWFPEVPVGLYQVRASASGHEDQMASLNVKPGLTAWTDLLLPTPTVTIEWEVVEKTIKDSYDIVLNATFETDVPGAVLVFTPPSVSIPLQAGGDNTVFHGELELTNEGTITAHNVTPPKGFSGGGVQLEMLGAPPETLAPGQKVKLPFRVTPLGPLDQCTVLTNPITTCYGYVCAYGKWVEDCTTAWTTAIVSPCPKKPSTGGGKTSYPSDPNEQPLVIKKPNESPTSYGGYYGSAGPKITGGIALGKTGCDKCELPDMTDDQKKCCEMGQYEVTGSAVGHLQGGYVDEVVDLKVATWGTDLLIRRNWRDNAWTWNHDGPRLTPVGSGDALTAVMVDGTSYSALDVAGTTFVSGKKQVTRDADGFLWTEPGGTWARFDAGGALKSTGDARGKILEYVGGAGGVVAAITDAQGAELIVFERDSAGRPTAVTDHTGRRVEYGWEQGRLASVTDVLARVTRYSYDSSGRVIKKAYPTGHELTITYSSDGLVSSVMDESGVGRWFTYAFNDATGESYSASLHTDGTLVESWYDSKGALIRKKVDGVDLVSLSEPPMGVSTSGGVVTTSSGDGLQTVVSEVDDLGRLVRRVDARGLVMAYEYDAAGALTKVERGVGTAHARTTEFTRDDLGQTTQIADTGADGVTRVATAEYDQTGNVTRLVDASGRETLRTYDAMRNKTSETTSDGVVHSWTWDAAGRLTEERIQAPGEDPLVLRAYSYSLREEAGAVVGERWLATDAAGRTTTLDLDTQGRLVRVTDPWGRAVKRTLDAKGRPVVDEAWDGSRWDFSYEALPFGGTRVSVTIDGALVAEVDRDAYGRTVRAVDDGVETHLLYEGARAVPSEITSDQGTVLLEYDALDRPVRTTWVLADGETLSTEATWDASGHASVSDPTVGDTTYLRDSFGRLALRIDALGAMTEHEYDSLGGLRRVIDANGLPLVELDRDIGGSITRRKLASGRTIDYTLDLRGGVTRRDDSTGARVEVERNLRGKPAEMTVWEPGDQAPSQVFTWTWDPLGRLVASGAAHVTRTAVRDDERGREEITSHFDGVDATWAQERDRRGLPTRIEAPGAVVEHTWSPTGRLMSATVSPQGGEGGETTSFAYPAPLQTVQTLPGGATVTTTRASLGRVRSVVVRDPGGNVTASREWSWNGEAPVTDSTPSRVVSHTYDATGRLVGSVHPELGETTAVWDGAGNRVQDESGPFVYGDWGQLLEGAGSTFNYDAAGNVATITRDGGTMSLTHDALGRLTSVEMPDGATLEYGYDGEGLLVKRESAGETTWRVYGEQGLVAELDAGGAALSNIGWTPGAGWQTAPLFLRSGGSTWWFVNDHLGAPWLLVSGEGDVVWRLESDPFGLGSVAAESSVTCPLRSSGQVEDPITALHLNTFRNYDPRTGRYLEPDPLFEEGGLTLYEFAEGRPTWRTDPLGLKVGAGLNLALDNLQIGMCLSAGLYIGVGAAASICLQGGGADCCTPDGEFHKFGQLNLTLTASVEAGTGIGATLGPVDLLYKEDVWGKSANCSLKGECGDRLGIVLGTGYYECCVSSTHTSGGISIGAFGLGIDTTKKSISNTQCFTADGGILAILLMSLWDPGAEALLSAAVEWHEPTVSESHNRTRATVGLGNKDKFGKKPDEGVKIDHTPGEAINDMSPGGDDSNRYVPDGTRIPRPLDKAVNGAP